MEHDHNVFSSKGDSDISSEVKPVKENKKGWSAKGDVIVIQELSEYEVPVITMSKQALDMLVAFSTL